MGKKANAVWTGVYGEFCLSICLTKSYKIESAIFVSLSREAENIDLGKTTSEQNKFLSMQKKNT